MYITRVRKTIQPNNRHNFADNSSSVHAASTEHNRLDDLAAQSVPLQDYKNEWHNFADNSSSVRAASAEHNRLDDLAAQSSKYCPATSCCGMEQPYTVVAAPCSADFVHHDAT